MNKYHVEHPNNRYESGQSPRLGDIIYYCGNVLSVTEIRFCDILGWLVLDCDLFEEGERGGFFGGYADGVDVQPGAASLISRWSDPDHFDERDGIAIKEFRP